MFLPTSDNTTPKLNHCPCAVATVSIQVSINFNLQISQTYPPNHLTNAMCSARSSR